MKKIIAVCVVLPFISVIYPVFSYSSDDTQRMHTQMQNIQRQQSSQSSQTARPILPPVVSPSPSVSPTASPHISAPSIGSIQMRNQASVMSQPSNTHMRNIPSVPTHATIPKAGIAAATELPQVPIIGNTIGKVINKGKEKNGIPWIEVKDDIFDEILKININPKSTPVIERTTVKRYADIKIGDTVSVIFNEQDQRATANFVSILTEEDLKAMEEAASSDQEEQVTEE